MRLKIGMLPLEMQTLLAHLFPRLEEDPDFRRELDALSASGLRIIVWISIGANLLAYALLFIWLDAIPRGVLIGDVLGALLLIVALAASYWTRARPYARALGLGVLFLATIGQLLAPTPPEVEFSPSQFLPVMLAITMMLGLACLPIKPMHALALGGSITAFAHWLLFGGVRLAEQELTDAFPVLVMVIITAVSVALTTAVYAQRGSAYKARRASEQSLEALQTAQSRLFVSETAASQNRLAAALCHELNSPLGALSSSLDTLVTAHDREREHPERIAKIERVFRDAAESGRASLARLVETVNRLKRITNLDRADEQEVDLNLLWRDTLALLEDEVSKKARLELDLESVPALRCQPQKLAAVFANLLLNASNAVDAGGTISVRGALRNGEVVFEVRDDGRGIPSGRLAGLFEPSFRNEGGRVVTTNWSMFVSRGIVTEHGGYIEVESEEGIGTTARVFLPVHA